MQYVVHFDWWLGVDGLHDSFVFSMENNSFTDLLELLLYKRAHVTNGIIIIIYKLPGQVDRLTIIND